MRAPRPPSLALASLVLAVAACDSKPGASPGAVELVSASAGAAPTPASRAEPGPGAAGAAHAAVPRAPRFRARRQWSLPTKPEFVVAADVDGDGRDDLLATTQEPGRLLLWRATPQGLLRAPVALDVGGYPLEPQLVARGAGRPPLVSVVSRATRVLTTWDLSGEPRIASTTALDETPRAIHAAAPHGFALACDGRALLLGRDADERADLRDALPRCVRVLSGEPRRVAVGFQDTRALHVLADDGTAVVLPLDGIPRDLEEADLDGDGDLELVAAGGDDALWIFGWGRPEGAQGWLAEDGRTPLVWRTERIPIDVDVTDLDGDGASELLVTHFKGLSCALLADFARSGPRAAWKAYVGQTARSACAVDVDGDGRRDLVVANRDSLALSVMRGTAAGGFEVAPSIAVGAFPNELAAGDLDGNGLADAAVTCAKLGAVKVLHNTGGELALLGRSWRDRLPTWSDLTRDGADELWLLSENDRESYVKADTFDANGKTVDWLTVPDLMGGAGAPGLGPGIRDLLAGDVTGDGFADFVVAKPETNVVALRRSRVGDGEYEAARPKRPGSSALGRLAFVAEDEELVVPAGPRALATLRDVGTVVIVAALGGPGEQRGFALLRATAGPLEEAARVASDGYPIDVATGDLDGDGRDDVVLLSNERHDGATGFVQGFLRRDGTRFEATARFATGSKPRHLAVGDLDGDGRADVVVAAQNAHAVNAWLARERDGRTALERLDDVGAGLGCLDVALADVDGDGALDLLVANAFSDDVSVILVEWP